MITEDTLSSLPRYVYLERAHVHMKVGFTEPWDCGCGVPEADSPVFFFFFCSFLLQPFQVGDALRRCKNDCDKLYKVASPAAIVS